MNIKQSMAGYIMNERYEIFESEQGSWRIWDLKMKGFVTIGGTSLFLDNKQEAIEFLKEQKLV